MKKQSKIISAIAILLLSVFVFTFVASAAYDYRTDSSSENEVINAARLLDEYLGFEVDEKEKTFLDKFTKFELSYNDIINTSKVALEYNEGALYIKADEYTYKADSGKTFSWKPSYAEVSGTRVELSEDGEGSICISEPAYESEIKVIYTALVEIENDDVNSFINLYRYTAEYAENIEKYDKQSAEYENYCLLKALYDDSYAEYSEYLAALEQYKKDKLAFDNYNLAVEQYKKDQAAYTAYVQELENYNVANSKYEAYVKKVEPFKKKLDALMLIDVSMTKLERTVYSAVMGGTVDQVLVNESAIVAAGAEKAAVRQAGDATKTVREVMEAFKACKTEAEKYQYYAQNYDKICNGFLKLTQALDVLYRNKLVRAKLVQEDKNEKYVILVCQLALISNALIDGELRDYKGNIAYNGTWKIDNRTISQILGNKVYYNDDNTSKPTNDPYPQVIEKPKEPQKVEKPIYPATVTEPAKPDVVENPGEAPAKVLEPVEPIAKQEAVLAIYKKLTADERASLASIFRKGEAPDLRNEYPENLPLEITSKVTKKYDVTPITLTFRVRDEESPEGYSELVLSVDPGSPVVYEGETPANYTDETGEYEFIGWKIESTQRYSSEKSVDLTKGFTEDTLITPLYDRAPTYYSVTWVVNSEEITETVISGIIPECPLELKKPEDDSVYYVFAGWTDEYDRKVEVTELIENCTYKAVFEKRYIVEAKNNKGAEITYDGNNAICDASDFIGNKIDISGLLERVFEKKKSLTLILPKGKLEFTFKDVYEMKNAGVEIVELSYSGNSTKFDSLLKIVKGDGELHNMKAKVELRHTIADTNMYKLVERTGDVSSPISYSSENGVLSFDARSGSEYKFRREYSVVVIPNELVDITTHVKRNDENCGLTSDEIVLNKDILFVDVKAKDGVEIIEVILTDSEGNKIDLNANGGLEIKKSDVIISVKARIKTYTITFTANGKVVSVMELLHGSVVTPPTPPQIASDGTYSYDFLSWDKEITDAVCDETYEATYSKTLLPIVEDEGGLKLSPRLKKLFYIAVAAVAVIILIIITLVIVFVII